MAYSVPTEAERPILFRWLRQQSSYTIWSKIEIYYTAWVGEFRRVTSLALDPVTNEPILNESENRLLLTCHAAFLEALENLRSGDRSVFKWLGYGTGRGYFCEAWRVIAAWQTARGRMQEGLPLADTEYWPEFERRLLSLVAAWGNGFAAEQRRYTDLPAQIDDMRLLRGEIEPQAYRVFRELRDCGLVFPAVPSPMEETVVRTGRDIPCYGIWEPVKLDSSPGVAGLFRKPLLPSDGQFELDGCMNYLHAGSPAPTIGFEDDDLRGEGRPTTWRLLWRDDRYLDGQVPDEEQEYVFVDPLVPQSDPPVRSLDGPDLIVASSGAVAPLTGAWAARELLGVRVHVAAAEPLPQHLGRDIEWVFVGGD